MKQRSLRATVDRELCVKSGECVLIAPGDFELDAEGISVFVGAIGDEARIEEAMNNCPSHAISIIRERSANEGGNQ